MTEKVELFAAVKLNRIKAIKDHVIVCDMQFDHKISHGGIILLSGDRKLEGIHPRWGRVYAIGPEQKNIRIGQWVCVKHGRWTRGFDIEDNESEKTIRRIDINDILLVSDERVEDENYGDNMGVTKKSR